MRPAAGTNSLRCQGYSWPAPLCAQGSCHTLCWRFGSKCKSYPRGRTILNLLRRMSRRFLCTRPAHPLARCYPCQALLRSRHKHHSWRLSAQQLQYTTARLAIRWGRGSLRSRRWRSPLQSAPGTCPVHSWGSQGGLGRERHSLFLAARSLQCLGRTIRFPPGTRPHRELRMSLRLNFLRALSGSRDRRCSRWWSDRRCTHWSLCIPTPAC